MKVYIAGPMTGHPELNFPAFHSTAAILRASGHEVANPAEINPDPTAKWQDCMLADLKELDTCDGIVMLPGWEHSPGAQIERLWAKRTGKIIVASTTLDQLEPPSLEEAKKCT